MRVAIFFDGKNFYKALQRYDSALEIDYDRFADWVTTKVGGAGAVFTGAYYYTGHVPVLPGSRQDEFTHFLAALEMRRGYFVRREPRVKRWNTCKKCGQSHEYRTEKRVDTRLVADLIQLAAVGAFDRAVLASGDQDFVPAVEAVGALGKQVFVGVWPGHGLSRELRVRCFGQVDFGDGAPEFRTSRRRTPVMGIVRTAAVHPIPEGTVEVVTEKEIVILALVEEELPGVGIPDSDAIDATMLEEIKRAQAKLPYVSQWYFENKWRGRDVLPTTPGGRRESIDRLAAAQLIALEERTDEKGRPFVELIPKPEVHG